MNILLLTIEYTPELSGGVGTHAEELTDGLASLGNHVTVLACAPRQAHTKKEPHKSVHFIEPVSPCVGSQASIANSLADFNRVIVSYASRPGVINPRPDVIQCCNWLTYLAASELGRKYGAPVVCSMHYVSHPIEQWWGQKADPDILAEEGKLLKSNHEFIAVSDSLREILEQVHKVPRERLHTVRNGLRCDVFCRTNGTDEHRLRQLRASIASEEDSIVLFAGRIHPQKGITAMLHSADQVVTDDSRVRYVIVGDPDSREASAQFREMLAARPKLKKNVIVLGKVPRSQLALLYKIANIALIPSIYEACCYAALEAMACAVPIVATDAGGIPEIVQHRCTGLLVPVHRPANGVHAVDVESLTSATKYLLKERWIAREMGLAGERRVKEVFSVEAMAQSTCEIYQIAIERSHP